MKCIKFFNGSVKKVSDVEAYLTVTRGEASYISKTEWKNNVYGLDNKLRETRPPKVDVPPESNKGLSKDEKQKEKKKKYKKERKKLLDSQKKSKNK